MMRPRETAKTKLIRLIFLVSNVLTLGLGLALGLVGLVVPAGLVLLGIVAAPPLPQPLVAPPIAPGPKAYPCW